MNDAASVRQMLHEEAGTTCMVEVNVRQKDEVDVGRFEGLLPQSIKQQGHGVVCARIDEGAAAVFYNEVARVLDRAQVLGIDGNNAIVKRRNLCVLIQAALSRGRRGSRSNARVF